MNDKNDYSDPAYIGKRYGNLTVLKHIGGQFLVKCDCGFEKPVKCSALNNRKTTTCGRIECEYHKKAMNDYGKHGELVRKMGEKTENDIAMWLKNLGYMLQQTPISQDYGVDIICIGRDGAKVAIQVKNNASTHSKTSVHAVQEVYAGGKYYDCDKFAVVSYTGYTDNAKKMADKLGVMLCNERCELYNPQRHYNVNTKYTWLVNGEEEAMIKTFRDHGWDYSHIKRFVGKTYEETKKYFDKRQIREKQIEIMHEKGVSQTFVEYRMQKMGMTFEQAINVPKIQSGRPRKQGESA